MARINLQLVSSYYDDETNRVVLGFLEAAPADDPDPASFKPTQTFTVHLVPDVVENQILEVVGSGSTSPSTP